MPFVQRVVNPVYVARKPPQSVQSKSKDIPDGHEGTSSAAQNGRPPGFVDNVPSGGGGGSGAHAPVEDNELMAVTNRTLSNALRQLASLVLIANDIFMDLNKELRTITERSTTIKVRITALAERVDNQDAKLVTVRKYTRGDLYIRDASGGKEERRESEEFMVARFHFAVDGQSVSQVIVKVILAAPLLRSLRTLWVQFFMERRA